MATFKALPSHYFVADLINHFSTVFTDSLHSTLKAKMKPVDIKLEKAALKTISANKVIQSIP